MNNMLDLKNLDITLYPNVIPSLQGGLVTDVDCDTLCIGNGVVALINMVEKLYQKYF